MSIFELNKMAFTSINLIRYKFQNLDRNLIGNEGCDYLSKADWPRLSILQLSKNEIESEGVGLLVQANWPLLKTI